MATVNNDLQAALNARLATLSAMPIAWENTSYTPTIGTAYLRCWLLPAEPRIASLGPDGIQENKGVFQIDVVCPAGAGWGSAKSKVDTLCTLFARGTVLTRNGLRVLIEKSWPGPAKTADGWYRIPVSILYSCYS